MSDTFLSDVVVTGQRRGNLRDDMIRMVKELGGGVRTNTFRSVIVPPALLERGPFLNEWLLNASCKSNEMPERALDSVTNKLGGGLQFEMPHSTQSGEVNVIFIIDKKLTVRDFFQAWQEMAVRYNTNRVGWYDDMVGEVRFTPMRNTASDRDLGTYVYENAWPKVVGKVTFDYEEENTIALLPVTFAYRRYSRE